jgi:hypothetical protein
MHVVPKGRPLSNWVNDAISWSRVIYLEHDKEQSDWNQFKPAMALPVVQRLPRSWARIRREYPGHAAQLGMLRPVAVAQAVLDPAPFDPGVERLAIARSKETQPSVPSIKYLETAQESYAPTDLVSDTVWDDAVCWAIDNRGSSGAVFAMAYAAWFAGDFEEVDQISTNHTINRFPEIKLANLTARNYLWLPRILALVKSAIEPTLVLVGAAHLGGPDGLVSRLASSGMKLTVLARQ